MPNLPPVTTPPRPSPNDTVAELQSMLGHAYSVEAALDADATVRTFSGTDTAGTPVVITVLAPSLGQGVNADRFQHEMEQSRALSHDRILPVLAAGAVDGLVYYVHRAVAGESLRTRLAREFRLKVSDVTGMLVSLCDTVGAAHQQGVVHGDIRPEHVICVADGCAISGFGVAPALARSRSTPADHGSGLTGGYLAPEQVRAGRHADHRTDVYGLGVLTYEMLAGERPYTSDAAARATGPLVAEPPRLAAVRRDIPRPLSDAVAKAMARDPRRRWSSPAQFRGALLKAVRPPSKRFMPHLATGAVVIALGAALLGFARYRAHRGLDDRLVAIAPVEVTDPTRRDWGPSLSLAMQNNVDGAGDLRTVAESLSAVKWMGRSDHDGAADFGRSVGARLAVYARLLPASHDSVRVAASVVDVMTRDAVGDEIEIQESSSRLDRLADSLALQVLREIAKNHPIGKVGLRRQSSGSR